MNTNKMYDDDVYQYSDFNEEVFKESVKEALRSVQRVLDVDRRGHPNKILRLAEDVDHGYTDKYKLANLLTNTAIISLTVVLERFGLTKDVLQSIVANYDGNDNDSTTLSKNKSTTLRFSASDSCRFVKEEIVDVPLPKSKWKETKEEATEVVATEFGTEEATTTTNKSTRIETTIVNRVTQEHYKIETEWELSIYSGTDVDNRRVIKSRGSNPGTASFDFVWAIPNNNKNSNKNRKREQQQQPPLPPKRSHDPVELSLTWLLQQIDTNEQFKSHFTIDTSPNNAKTTKTPSRNLQIEEALSFFRSLKEWTHRVGDRFAVDYPRDIFDRHSPATTHNSDEESSLIIAGQNLQSLTSNGIFVPVIPLLVDRQQQQQQQQQQGDGVVQHEEAVSSGGGDAIESESESKAMITSQQQQTTDGVGTVDDGDDDDDSSLSSSSRSPILLSVVDTTSFLNEQIRTLDEAQQKIQQQYDPDDYSETSTNTNSSTSAAAKLKQQLISSVEAYMYVLCLHAEQLTDRYVESIQYIEFMLEKQLVAAMGKKVNSADLDKFMRYHNEKMMLNPYNPKPFCYTIRRPGHYPDGIVSIEQEVVDINDNTNTNTNNNINMTTTTIEPISTHVRELTSSVPSMKVPLNAATTLELTGQTYLHGWLNHRFRDNDNSNTSSSNNFFRLNARARQFSSFVLLVGTMTSHDRMQPKDAIILRNKDEINIPLLLNEIPTATEFKDAIGSLSPEQQQFAKAFRSMQLGSSVLGVCVIQIKPQLEKLLGLPNHSLTKEMKLTQDLTELFVEYQVPSDLVSYYDSGGGEVAAVANNNESVKDKVASVKNNVKSVLDVIADQKKEQLEAQAMATDMALERRVADEMDNYNIHEQQVFKRKSGGARHGRRMTPMTCAKALRAPIPQTPPPQFAACAAPYNFSEDAFGGEQENAEFSPAMLSGTTRTSLSTSKLLVKDTKSSSSSSPSMDEHPVAGGYQKQNTVDVMDFTAMPKVLDGAIEIHDKDAALRSTTIETSKYGWTRNRQKNLLSKSKKDVLTATDIASEKSKAFDLLDALSRSGSLAIPFSELHVVICATHRFEKNVMETVIRDNINPIEKLEMSTLLMASTILDIPARDLIRNEEERERLAVSFPRLLGVDVDVAGSSPVVSPSTSTVLSSATSAATTSADITTVDDHTYTTAEI